MAPRIDEGVQLQRITNLDQEVLSGGETFDIAMYHKQGRLG
jgi:hypothetical protein